MFSDDMVALFGVYLEEDDKEHVRHDMANEGVAEAASYASAS